MAGRRSIGKTENHCSRAMLSKDRDYIATDRYWRPIDFDIFN